jgi:hypothetical protein
MSDEQAMSAQVENTQNIDIRPKSLLRRVPAGQVPPPTYRG